MDARRLQMQHCLAFIFLSTAQQATPGILPGLNLPEGGPPALLTVS